MERSHGRQDSERRSARVRLLNPPTPETTMQVVADRAEAPTAIQTDLRAIFVSLELSRSTWLITSLSPGGGEKMSKHSVRGCDVAGLLERFAHLREKARARTGQRFPISVIQEAGLDGFWIHRMLNAEGLESHVIDPASIATSRRRWRVCDGQGADSRGGRPPPSLPRAQGADCRACSSRQSYQGAAILPGDN